MAILDVSLSLRSNLSTKKLREDNPSWSNVMVDDYLGLGANTAIIVEQINENTGDIENLFDITDQLRIDVDINTEDIAENFQYLHGSEFMSPDYDESASYVTGEKATYEGNEYSAQEDIGAPAGSFNPLLWREVSTVANFDYIEETRQGAVNAFVYAAYAGLGLDSPPTAFPDIDATYQTINIFDVETITPSRGVTASTANNSMILDLDGVYFLSLNGAFSHNSSNAGRQTFIKIYNITDATDVGSPIPVGVGRNVEATSIPVNTAFNIDQSLIGKELVAQIGGGDTLTNVEFASISWSFHSIGEYRGEL